MIQSARPEIRTWPQGPAVPWLATLMIGTAVAAFAPAAGAQTATTGEPAAEAGTDAASGGDASAAEASGAEASGGEATGDAAADPAAADAPDADAAESQPDASGDAGAAATGDLRQAAAALRNADGTDIGTVIITETDSGLMHFILDISEGALPAAQHAIHIHETGACEAPTFESAGGHLAGDKEHGVHSANGPHPGDLPNITMGAAGALHVEYFLPGVLLDQVLDDDGAAVVIHSEVDDYTTQPSGNAGDRLACGVLELST